MNIRRFASIPVLTLALWLAALASLPAQTPPANDDFANRQVIPSETKISVAGSTINATQEPFEKVNAAGSPAGDSINETKTVWYQWTPPVSGMVEATFSSFTSAGLTYLLVFEGSSVPTLSQLIGQGYLPGDNGVDGVFFKVTGGQVYTLSLGNTNYPGDFTLQLDLTPAVPNVVIGTPQPVAIRSTGQKGELLFTLSAPENVPLTLHYQVAGNALPGIDYKRLRGTVVVPAGASTAQINVKPLPKGTDENGKPTKVKVTLEAGTEYTVGSPATATVKIREHP